MRSYILIAISALLLASCAKDPKISWDLKTHADMLVVESLISSDTVNHAIRLTLSNTYYDSKSPRPVSEALVSVSDGSKIYTFTESPENKGLYFSSEKFAGITGKTYGLTIKLKSAVNGLTEYKSSSTMPQGMKMDSIKCEIYEMPDLGEQDEEKEGEKDTALLAVYYFGKEPKTSNYYCAKAFRNKVPLQADAREYFTIESRQDNSYAHLATYGKNVKANDTITFKLYTIDRSYFQYLEAIRNIDQTGMAMSMSGPPANAVGNIPNALGFFVVASVSAKTAKAEDFR